MKKRNLTEAAKAAKAIKVVLRKSFPGVKFSVKSENFANGNAVNISWTDGPFINDVEEITSKYKRGHFNSMEDIYENSNKNTDIPQAKYVQCSRELSYETQLLAIETLEEKCGIKVKWSMDRDFDDKLALIVEDTYIDNFNTYATDLIHKIGHGRMTF